MFLLERPPVFLFLKTFFFLIFNFIPHRKKKPLLTDQGGAIKCFLEGDVKRHISCFVEDAAPSIVVGRAESLFFHLEMGLFANAC